MVESSVTWPAICVGAINIPVGKLLKQHSIDDHGGFESPSIYPHDHVSHALSDTDRRPFTCSNHQGRFKR